MIKNKMIDLCKAIALSTFVAFVCFFMHNVLVRAILENVDNKNPVFYCLNMLTFAACFYFFRIKKLNELIITGGKFDPINEAKKYFHAEGKYLMCIYFVLAVLCELNTLSVPDGSGVVCVTLCSMVFPFFASIKIPILRSVLNFLLANIIPLLLYEYYSYKMKSNE